MASVQVQNSSVIGSFDIAKFIFSFAIVAIHVQSVFFHSKTAFIAPINWFIRLGVPVFFILSGYLVNVRLSKLSDIDRKRVYLKKKALGFLKLFIIWLIIYLPLSISDYFDSNTDLKIYILKYIIKLVFFGETILSYPLWYLYSSFFIYFILTFTRRIKIEKIAICFAIIYIIGLYTPPITLPAISQDCLIVYSAEVLSFCQVCL